MAETELNNEIVELVIGGKAYKGWTDIEVTIAIDQIASFFTLALTEKRDPDSSDEPQWDIEAGEACQVRIGGETVITGYIDRLDADVDAEMHSISVAGRSKAADLIDCSAMNVPGKWTNQKLETIAADLAQPFSVDVETQGDTGAAFKSFALEPGETPAAAIQRMASMRGLLVMSDPAGGIVIRKPEPFGQAIEIKQGIHPLRLAVSHDVSERFSKIVVKGQSAGDDDINGKAASQIKAEADDKAIKRHRTLLVIADEQATPASLKTRAAWEISVRAARAQTPSAAMPLWRAAGGNLWQLMQKVKLTAPAIWVEAELMVASVTFSKNDSGSFAELGLAYQGAYTPEPVAEVAQASKIRKQAA